jgi:hypothetical protein
MEAARRVTPDIDILPSYFTVPGFGTIPVNAYVLKAQQPVLIDTGLHQDHEQFMAALASVIEPAEIKWLWLTHPDPDHVGSLRALVEGFPNIRVITTFVGLGMLSLFNPLPPERVYFLNPGEELDIGDRKIVAMRPPTFDNPATTAMYDTKSRALFSSDSFGALLQAPADEAYAIGAKDLREGQLIWSTLDSPWLHKVDESKFGAELENIRKLDPTVVLSSHLPPARGMLGQLLGALADAPKAPVFVGPSQAAFESMLAQMTGAHATA